MSDATTKITGASTPAGWELHIERVFDAPRALVFEMWSKREHLERWWKPTGFTLPFCDMDFRPGGKWNFIFRGYGMEHRCDSVYREIIVPERIVFVGTVTPFPGEVHTTLTFSEQDGKTLLTVHQIHTVEIPSTKDAQIGWTQTLDNLEALLAEKQGASRKS